MGAYPRNKSIWIWPWCQVHAHNISTVTMEALQHLTRLHIPQSTCRITRTSQYLDMQLNIWLRVHYHYCLRMFF